MDPQTSEPKLTLWHFAKVQYNELQRLMPLYLLQRRNNTYVFGESHMSTPRNSEVDESKSAGK